MVREFHLDCPRSGCDNEFYIDVDETQEYERETASCTVCDNTVWWEFEEGSLEDYGTN